MFETLKMAWLASGICAAATVIFLYRFAPEEAKMLFGDTDPAKVAGAAGALGIVSAALLLCALNGMSVVVVLQDPPEDQP
jgi:hypothetical protein